MADLLISFLASAVRVATPLLLAALGEMLAERSGVINLGIEGAMLAGALAAAVGATHWGPWPGTAAAIVAGSATAAVFAGIAVGAGAYRDIYGTAGVGLSLPTFPVLPVPGLSRIPFIGPALFQQTVLTYVAYAAVPLLWVVLFRTRWGLTVRASGESTEAAVAAGVRVRWVRSIAVVVGGAFAGLSGASLVLAQVGTFAEKMTAGRGFMAIAIVVLGGWRPWRIAGAALFFGAAMALQFVFQSVLLGVPYQAFLMLPYILTLIVLAGAVGRVKPPAELGRD